jgi:hypothetical protein
MGGMNRRTFLGGALALAGCGLGVPRCGGLTDDDLDQGIALGGRYLSTAITGADEFVYEVDWQTDMSSIDPDGVRQAGATFGLLDHAARSGDAAALAAGDRVLRRWLGRRRILSTGTTFVWGKQGLSRMGTTSLLGLACAARAALPDPPEGTRDAIDGAVAFVRATRHPDGGFHDRYDTFTEKARPERSPYADGEALLFLTTLAVHHGRTELVPEILAWAERDWERNVRDPLAAAPDPDTTKGYYQWASMSWANLVAGGHDPERWGRRLTDLATWMIDVHGTLKRSRNTAYAYEGIVPAYVEAVRRGDRALADHFACTIHQGLAKLCSWQLGHPRAIAEIAAPPERWRGGIQNEVGNRKLRVDVVQHQLHALWLAKDSGVVRHSFA